MAKISTSLTVQQSSRVGLLRYKVVSLRNRTTPRVGDMLTEPELKALIRGGVAATVK